jgi:hypothetical protein
VTVELGQVYKHSNGHRYTVTFIAARGTKIDGRWNYERLVCYANEIDPIKSYARFESDFLTSMTLQK